MATGESSTPNNGRQPFQFTLRQLMAAMGAVCVLAAAYWWIGTALFLRLFVLLMLVSAYFAMRRRFVGAAVTVAFTALFISLILPPIHTGVSYSIGACQNNIHNLALALRQYESHYGTLPPAYIADADGKPMHSWRVLLLPYLDQRNLYKEYRFDEPWDGPNNSALAEEVRRLKIFECPRSNRNGETSYVAVTGRGTMWPGAKATKMSEVKDGTSNTIMLVEVHNSGIHWMEPRDLDMSQMSMVVNSPAGNGISSGHLDGRAHVVFASGETRAIDASTSPKALRAALSIAGGEKEVLPARREPR